MLYQQLHFERRACQAVSFWGAGYAGLGGGTLEFAVGLAALAHAVHLAAPHDAYSPRDHCLRVRDFTSDFPRIRTASR